MSSVKRKKGKKEEKVDGTENCIRARTSCVLCLPIAKLQEVFRNVWNILKDFLGVVVLISVPVVALGVVFLVSDTSKSFILEVLICGIAVVATILALLTNKIMQLTPKQGYIDHQSWGSPGIFWILFVETGLMIGGSGKNSMVANILETFGVFGEIILLPVLVLPIGIWNSMVATTISIRKPQNRRKGMLVELRVLRDMIFTFWGVSLLLWLYTSILMNYSADELINGMFTVLVEIFVAVLIFWHAYELIFVWRLWKSFEFSLRRKNIFVRVYIILAFIVLFLYYFTWSLFVYVVLSSLSKS